MAASVYKSILDVTLNEIVGLNLDGIPSANVVLVKVPRNREGPNLQEPKIPGVLIWPGGPETLPVPQSTNQSDALGYAVGVTMVAGDRGTGEQDQVTDFDKRLYWRERIRNKFSRQRFVLQGHRDAYTVEIEPRNPIDPQQWLRRNMWVSTMLLRFMTRELVRV